MADDKQTTLISKMSSHNTAELKKFFEGSELAGDWQLIFSSSYSACVVSLPAKQGGEVHLNVAAKFSDGTPYLELQQSIAGSQGDVEGKQDSGLEDRMSAHNTAQLKAFLEGVDLETDWHLIFASSYNGCIISLPANRGGQVRLRIAAKYRDDYPYLELRNQRVGGEEEEE